MYPSDQALCPDQPVVPGIHLRLVIDHKLLSFQCVTKIREDCFPLRDFLHHILRYHDHILMPEILSIVQCYGWLADNIPDIDGILRYLPDAYRGG